MEGDSSEIFTEWRNRLMKVIANLEGDKVSDFVFKLTL